MGLLWKSPFMNGWTASPIPSSQVPLIDGVYLSGTKVIVLDSPNYVVEHEVPALEGGIIERIGSRATQITIKGFFSSGDIPKATLQSYTNSVRSFVVPSFMSGKYFFSGLIQMEKLNFENVGGFAYPVYDFVIEGVVSGTAQSGVFVNPTVPLPGLCSGTNARLVLTESWNTIDSGLWDWSNNTATVDNTISNSPNSSIFCSAGGQPTGLLKASGYTNVLGGAVTTWIYMNEGQSNGAPYCITFLNQAASGSSNLTNSYYIKTLRNGIGVPNQVLAWAKQVNGVETVVGTITYPPPTTLPLNTFFQIRVSWCSAGVPSSGVTMRLEVNTGNAQSPVWTQWGSDVTDLNGGVGATWNRVGITVSNSTSPSFSVHQDDTSLYST